MLHVPVPLNTLAMHCLLKRALSPVRAKLWVCRVKPGAKEAESKCAKRALFRGSHLHGAYLHKDMCIGNALKYREVNVPYSQDKGRIYEEWRKSGRKVEEDQYQETLYMPECGADNGRIAGLKVITTKIIN